MTRKRIATVLILWLGLLFSRKSTASSMNLDSLGPLVARPIHLSEAGARMALQYKLKYEQGLKTLMVKDSIIAAYRTHTAQTETIVVSQISQEQTTLNALQQASRDSADYRRRWHEANRERWAWRVGTVVIGGLVISLRLHLF